VLEHLKALHLHVDARAGDRLFWFTTTGWMMWNFLLGGLLTEAAVVLYDGNPAQPDLGVLWDLAEHAGINLLRNERRVPLGMHEGRVRARGRARPLATAERRIDGLTSLPDGFRWVYEHVGADTWALLDQRWHRRLHRLRRRPSRRCPSTREISGPRPRAKVESFDEAGKLARRRGRRARADGAAPLDAAVPVGGCRRLPLQGELLRRLPGIWRHGDWIEITSRGRPSFYGRSDSTVNRGGASAWARVRSTARRSRSTDRRRARGGSSARGNGWLAVPVRSVPRDPGAFDDRLVAEIRQRIRSDCSPRHVPDEIVAVPEIPRTLSGKNPRSPGSSAPDGSALERVRPRFARESHALDWFVDRARSRQSP